MSGSELTDEELLDVIRGGAGDSAALELLLARHVGRVRSIVYPLVLHDADADDVTQETLLHALRGLEGFRADACFATWLYRVAVNTARNHLRSRRRRAARFEADEGRGESVDSPCRSPVGMLEASELDQAVKSALARLPEEQRIALSLVVFQGLPDAEAAQAAGCAHATLRWRLFRARRRMRHLLAGHLDAAQPDVSGCQAGVSSSVSC